MLERLNEVPWSRLTDCQGKATDVPALLRALASRDPRGRAKAMDELCQKILHQGAVCEATSYAAPFLVDLLGTPAVADREVIAALVAAIAGGQSYLQADGEASPEELGWAKRAHDAVAAGVPGYLTLLEGASPAFELSVVLILVNLPEHAEAFSARLHDRLGAPDPMLRLGCAAALCILGDRSDGVLETLQTDYERRAAQELALGCRAMCEGDDDMEHYEALARFEEFVGGLYVAERKG